MIRRSFTLIEVVVAIGIFMAVMGVAGFLFASVQSSWQAVAGAEQRLLQLQTIDRVWDSAVRNAIPFHWKDRNNKETMLFSGEPERLYLTTLHRINDRKQGGLRFLELHLSGSSLIAAYRQTPILSETDHDDPTIRLETLAEGIKRLKFQYVDLRDGELQWFDEWDCERQRNLPVAIQLELEFADGKREVWLRRTAGAGRYQQFGNRLPSLR